jgi:hypothetical protein
MKKQSVSRSSSDMPVFFKNGQPKATPGMIAEKNTTNVK